MSRYWRPSSQTVQVEREPGVRRPSPELSRGIPVGQNWPDEPSVGRVAYGVPNRVDRLKCLGNAVVPQQFYPFFAAIAEIERRMEDE
jgi:DNA (cytosine-5)-methyltransferase 1